MILSMTSDGLEKTSPERKREVRGCLALPHGHGSVSGLGASVAMRGVQRPVRAGEMYRGRTLGSGFACTQG